MNHPSIALLPSNVIDRIAAGEVVERPASVVKELLENALDAGATEIHLSLKGGGVREIRLVDNGHGMNAEDARLCLIRHATSKIRTDSDLERIHTLGFRGEALASIAAVSEFRLETGMGLSEPGFRVAWQAGGPQIVENAPRSGTLIVASELFGNVPARRKFLKAERTELNHIMGVVRRAALANTGVGFEVEHEGKKLLKARPTQDLRARVQSVFGKALAKRMFAVTCQDLVSVTGILSAPSDAKASTQKLHLMINGRPIRDGSVLAAIRQGYGPLLASGTTPQGVIHIKMDPASVDVNVHPRKSEVRFADPRIVFRTVLQATRSAVSEMPWLESTRQSQHQVLSLFGDQTPGPVPPTSQSGGPRPDHTTPYKAPHASPSASPAPESPQKHSQPSPFAQMRFMGQVAESFWLLDDGASLVLVDQHAAHELVLRREIQLAFTDKGLCQQPLLFPESITLAPDAIEHFNSLDAALNRCGFDADVGGPDRLTLRAVPAILRQADFTKLIPMLMSELRKDTPLHENRALHTLLACHAAVRAGDTVGEEESRAILSALNDTSPVEERPHGRRAVHQFAYDELSAFFDHDNT